MHRVGNGAGINQPVAFHRSDNTFLVHAFRDAGGGPVAGVGLGRERRIAGLVEGHREIIALGLGERVARGLVADAREEAGQEHRLSLERGLEIVRPVVIGRSGPLRRDDAGELGVWQHGRG